MRRKRASGDSADPRGLAGPAGEVGSWSLHARALTKPLSIHTPAPAAVKAATLAPKPVGPQLPTYPLTHLLRYCSPVLRTEVKLCKISEHRIQGHMWTAR